MQLYAKYIAINVPSSNNIHLADTGKKPRTSFQCEILKHKEDITTLPKISLQFCTCQPWAQLGFHEGGGVWGRGFLQAMNFL